MQGLASLRRAARCPAVCDPTTMTSAATPSFRPARTSDVEIVIGFMRAFYAHAAYPFDEGEARAALLGVLGEDSPHGRVWLVEADGRAMGYVAVMLGYSLEYRGRDAFVDELWIEAQWRGRGLGAAALAHAESACRALGVRALHLEVERDNDTGKRLYRRAGYADDGRILMTKRLRP
jgi:ribosomal protein S18 acetylase RimI-like enzyme